MLDPFINKEQDKILTLSGMPVRLDEKIKALCDWRLNLLVSKSVDTIEPVPPISCAWLDDAWKKVPPVVFNVSVGRLAAPNCKVNCPVVGLDVTNTSLSKFKIFKFNKSSCAVLPV